MKIFSKNKICLNSEELIIKLVTRDMLAWVQIKSVGSDQDIFNWIVLKRLTSRHALKSN